jgi:hypothetical protein
LRVLSGDFPVVKGDPRAVPDKRYIDVSKYIIEKIKYAN